MLPGSLSTSTLPAGQDCAQEASLGAGEQRLVAVMHTPPALQPPAQGGSPTQKLLKQVVPSAQEPPGPHLFQVQPRPEEKTPMVWQTCPRMGQEPSWHCTY